MKTIIGLDQGTSATKAVLISHDGSELENITVPVPLPYSSGGNRFQNPDALFESVVSALDELIDSAVKRGCSVTGIGISCQRSGVLAWDKYSKKALHPMYSWQDTSTKESLERLGPAVTLIYEKTGLPPNGHYAGGKIALLQKIFTTDSSIVGTLDTFLLHSLTGILVTEDTFAARSMLYNLTTTSWDAELCTLLGVDIRRLPPINASVDGYGRYHDIPVRAVLGDQQAAFFGISDSKVPVLTIGSSASLLLPTGDSIKRIPGYISNPLQSIANELKRNYLYQIEATTNSSGRIPEIIVTDLNLVSDYSQINTAYIQAESHHTGQLPVIFASLGDTAAPDWKRDLPDLVYGTYADSPELLTLALMDSVAAFITYDILAFINAQLIDPLTTQIIVSGGGSRYDCLLQFIADCTKLTILRPKSVKGSALGIAKLAHSESAIPQTIKLDQDIFSPGLSKAPERFTLWCALKEKAYAKNYTSSEVITLPR